MASDHPDWGDLMTLDDYTEPVARKPRKRGGAKRNKKAAEAKAEAEEADRTTEATEPTEEEELKGAAWVLQAAQQRKAGLERRLLAAVQDSKAEAPVLAAAQRLDAALLFGGKWLLRGEDALRKAQHCREDPAQAKRLVEALAARTACWKELVVVKTQGTPCARLGQGLAALCDQAGAKALLLLQEDGPVTAVQAAAAWSVEHVYRPLRVRGDCAVGALCSVRSANAEQVTLYTQKAKAFTDAQAQLAADRVAKLKAQVTVATDQSAQYVWGTMVLMLGEEHSRTLKTNTQAAVDKTLPRLPAALRRFFQPAHAA